jgi:putative radical SAM enzyme (TIGR03279 family)
LNFQLERNQKKISVSMQNDLGKDLGLAFEPMSFRCCGNQCIFCFIDQNPKGLRPGIYLKDEDYRYSFLYGNYVTLTNAKQSDLNRIAEQRLSPLYISIHATESHVRKSILGLKKDDHLLEKIQFLAEHGIEMHGQIVLCPGINDGPILKKTLNDLIAFYPSLLSMALVPVGLTRHRKNLKSLTSFDSQSAKELIKSINHVQSKYDRQLNTSFVYLSDEFYLLAHEALPSDAHYGEYWQIDNGVGMTRAFLEHFTQDAHHFPDALNTPERMIIVTGALAGPVLQENILPRLQQIHNLKMDIRIIQNDFYGDSVTVSGLLTGQDILNTLRKENGEYTALLPANCLNDEELFLDDISVTDLSNHLSRNVKILHHFSELWPEHHES